MVAGESSLVQLLFGQITYDFGHTERELHWIETQFNQFGLKKLKSLSFP